jgi:hypothetical protein
MSIASRRPGRSYRERVAVLIATLGLVAMGASNAAAQATMTTPVEVGRAAYDIYSRISGDWIVYTTFPTDEPPAELCYYHLSDPSRRACLSDPLDVHDRRYSDVSGTTAVVGDITAVSGGVSSTRTIAVFDLNALGSAPVDLLPDGQYSDLPTIGGSTVVFSAYVPTDTSLQRIVIYDRITQLTTYLAGYSGDIRMPHVSPDGSVIVWSQCKHDPDPGRCEAWQAVKTTGGWIATAIPQSTTADVYPPATDGVTVAFSTGTGDAMSTDLCWRAVAPGPGAVMQCLNQPGLQFLPTISGRAIVFVGGTDLNAMGLYVLDTASGVATLLRKDPGRNVAWPDLDGAGHVFNLTWSEENTVRPAGTVDVGVYLAVVSLSPSAPALLQQLIDTVRLENLKKGIANSLDAKLTNAQAALAAAQAGNYANACGALSAFINEVQAQSGKSITVAQATQFIAAANDVRAEIGCVP